MRKQDYIPAKTIVEMTRDARLRGRGGDSPNSETRRMRHDPAPRPGICPSRASDLRMIAERDCPAHESRHPAATHFLTERG